MNYSATPPWDKIHKAKSAILNHDPKKSLLDTINNNREAFSGLRLLYASDHGGAPIQEKLTDSYVVPIFCGRGMLAFSDYIENQMQRGIPAVTFKVRAIFDTNILSDLPSYFSGKQTPTREKIKNTLKFIEDNFSRSADWTFPSLENLREAAKPNNPWPYIKVAAIRHFETSGLTPADADQLEVHIPAAEDQWSKWLAGNDCWLQIRRRDLFYAVLLFAVVERWKGVETHRALGCLVNFCLDSFDTIPLKEIYFAWKLLKGSEPSDQLSIFSEPALLSPSKKSLSRISALAWDLFLFRWCETLMTEMKDDNFFIPVITTLDEDLIGVIKACPLRALLIDDANGKVEAIFDDEIDFQKCLLNVFDKKMQEKINNQERQQRSGRFSRYRLSFTINSLEQEICKMTKSGD